MRYHPTKPLNGVPFSASVASRQHVGFQQYNGNRRIQGAAVMNITLRCCISLVCGRSAAEQVTMRQEDRVQVIGRDGLYVFLNELQGTATLRIGGAKSPDTPTLTIAMHLVSWKQQN